MDETTNAYFAGLFDGEGSVGVYRTQNGKLPTAPSSRKLPYLREKRAQAELALLFCEGKIDGEVVSAQLKAAKVFEYDGKEIKATGGNAGDLNPSSKKYKPPG